jgi:hypothetical protein
LVYIAPLAPYVGAEATPLSRLAFSAPAFAAKLSLATAANAPLYGDPTKPGPYAYFNKWKTGNMSRPHFHENDRYISVLAGTWWVGSGKKFDPESTVPLGAGTTVIHTGKQVHYDGAKQGEAILLIHGIGPATSTLAEEK